jgi:hypothetical protein
MIRLAYIVALSLLLVLTGCLSREEVQANEQWCAHVYTGQVFRRGGTTQRVDNVFRALGVAHVSTQGIRGAIEMHCSRIPKE